MKNKTILLAGLIALMLALPLSAAEPKGKGGIAGRLKVMTQNVYVGADLFEILDEAEPVPVNAAQIFGAIQFTDFHQRAEAIADLIDEHKPHLIGLQEVSLIRTQCPSDLVLDPFSGANATEVYADYLDILLAALDARGLDYGIAESVNNADVEMPVLNLGIMPDCQQLFFDARLTDRDVTLKRGDVDVTFSFSDNYQANFPVPTPAGDIVFTRGFNIVDIDLHGREYRFANTHLEVNGNPYANFFQFAQAYELTQILDGMAELDDRIVVVAGDLNSDPEYGESADCLTPPLFDEINKCPTPYTVMAMAGFIDSWWVRNGAPEPGYTYGNDALLDNLESEMYERIDHIWLRGPVGGTQGPNFLTGVHATVVGTREEDRTDTGLWPSDHAGVVAGMTFRQEK